MATSSSWWACVQFILKQHSDSISNKSRNVVSRISVTLLHCNTSGTSKNKCYRKACCIVTSPDTLPWQGAWIVLSGSSLDLYKDEIGIDSLCDRDSCSHYWVHGYLLSTGTSNCFTIALSCMLFFVPLFCLIRKVYFFTLSPRLPSPRNNWHTFLIDKSSNASLYLRQPETA